MDDDRFRAQINMPDKEGLTAYEHAQLALPETLIACHPAIENPFVLVPFMVQLPYYDNRQPFGKITGLLEQAGAVTDVDRARSWWLEKCSNTDSDARDRVEETQNLYGSLSTIGLVHKTRMLKRDVEKHVEIYRMLIESWPAEKRPTPEELRKRVRKFYSDAGLQSPD